MANSGLQLPPREHSSSSSTWSCHNEVACAMPSHGQSARSCPITVLHRSASHRKHHNNPLCCHCLSPACCPGAPRAASCRQPLSQLCAAMLPEVSPPLAALAAAESRSPRQSQAPHPTANATWTPASRNRGKKLPGAWPGTSAAGGRAPSPDSSRIPTDRWPPLPGLAVTQSTTSWVKGHRALLSPAVSPLPPCTGNVSHPPSAARQRSAPCSPPAGRSRSRR